jgi:hypothetical protein
MQRFHRTIDDLQLAELYLHGRLYTWSNERSAPTLEHIDRAFATVAWLERRPTIGYTVAPLMPLIMRHYYSRFAQRLGHYHDFTLKTFGRQSLVSPTLLQPPGRAHPVWMLAKL